MHCREEWAKFSESAASAERAAQLAEGGLAFAFQEGALVKALRQGHWVLLDEINLAPSDVSNFMLPSGPPHICQSAGPASSKAPCQARVAALAQSICAALHG